MVHNSKTRSHGTAQHLIVTVEQLFKSREGHFTSPWCPRTEEPLSEADCRVNFDEAHFIHTAGMPLHGLAPFRPAWGQLDELKALLPQGVHWAAFSVTFPTYILRTVESKVLRQNYASIHITSNRPNTMYATHCVENKIDDPPNYECFLTAPFDPHDQPRVLIFADNKDLTNTVASHLNHCLPVSYQGKGIIRHYHSGMSQGYLQQAREAFTKDNGLCRILVTTSGQSVVSSFAFSS